MPPDFFFPRGTQYWTPAARELAAIAAAAGEPLKQLMDGRRRVLRRGAAQAGSQACRRASAGVLFIEAEAEKHGIDLSAYRIQMTPLLDHVFGPARYALILLMGAVVLVLLIACGNVAGLMFARGAAGGREMALRAALGASRGALVRQLLIESAVIAAAGSAAGAGRGEPGADTLVGLSPADIPRLEATAIDGAVLAFAIACAAATTVAVGLAPALRLSRPSLVEDLKGGDHRRRASGRQCRRPPMADRHAGRGNAGAAGCGRPLPAQLRPPEPGGSRLQSAQRPDLQRRRPGQGRLSGARGAAGRDRASARAAGAASAGHSRRGAPDPSVRARADRDGYRGAPRGSAGHAGWRAGEPGR